MPSRSPKGPTCLKSQIGPRKDKRTGARTHAGSAPIIRPDSPMCSKHIAKNPHPHTPVSCSHTCSTCSASGLCLFRCPWLSNHPPPTSHLHCSLSLLFLSVQGVISGIFLHPVCPGGGGGGMWSLWLIRGSPVSNCPQPQAQV